MPFLEPGIKMNPYVLPGINALDAFAGSRTLGPAGRGAKGILKQLGKGDFSGLAGTILAPISMRSAANTRAALRENTMGGNALFAGEQPALMANIEQDTRRKMAESEGMAFAEAIPQLYSAASSVFQNAKNSREAAELNALEAATRARLGATYQTPSGLDKFRNLFNTAAGVASAI